MHACSAKQGIYICSSCGRGGAEALPCSLSGSGLGYALAGAQCGWSTRKQRSAQTTPVTHYELSTTMVCHRARQWNCFYSKFLESHIMQKVVDGIARQDPFLCSSMGAVHARRGTS